MRQNHSDRRLCSQPDTPHRSGTSSTILTPTRSSFSAISRTASKISYPAFGEAIFPYLSEANEELLRFPERAADLLINEILAIGRAAIHSGSGRLSPYRPRYHRSQAGRSAAAIFVRPCPPDHNDPRPSAARDHAAETQSAALVITRDDLLFTDDEVQELFRQTLNVELKDEEIAEYRERTHGWITALQLVRQVAEQEMHSANGPAALDLHEILQQSENDIFDYFAEEVFSREPAETQKLLMDLSLLESLPLDRLQRVCFPDLRCSACTARARTEERVSYGCRRSADRRGISIPSSFPRFSAPSPSIRDRPGTASPKNGTGSPSTFSKANSGRWPCPTCLTPKISIARRRSSQKTADEWIAAGAFTSLGICSRNRYPTRSLEKYPRSLLHKAEVARLHGEIEKSSKLLNRAVKLLNKTEDTTGEAKLSILLPVSRVAAVDTPRRSRLI